MNKVFIVGNLTRDPEAQVTTSGISYCRFSVAVSRRFANASGERETDFLNCITWRGLADNCAKYLKKGNKVAVCGSIQVSQSEKDGVTRYFTDIVADDVEFLTPKNQQEDGGYSAPSYNSQPKEVGKKTSISDMRPVEDEDLPF
ncbi:MAG: single-stranded DNA-binding protein [Bacillota bacterium]